MAMRHLQGLRVCQNKRKTRRRKKKDQRSEMAELRTTVYSQATMSASVVSLQRLGRLAELTMLRIGNQTVLPLFTL